MKDGDNLTPEARQGRLSLFQRRNQADGQSERSDPRAQPVTFRYKKELDPEGIPQFGLVAEQVEKVNPDLVARDEQGKPYTVRYEAVNAMLLNEFLKEHRKVRTDRDRQIDEAESNDCGTSLRPSKRRQRKSRR